MFNYIESGERIAIENAYDHYYMFTDTTTGLPHYNLNIVFHDDIMGSLYYYQKEREAGNYPANMTTPEPYDPSLWLLPPNTYNEENKRVEDFTHARLETMKENLKPGESIDEDYELEYFKLEITDIIEEEKVAKIEKINRDNAYNKDFVPVMQCSLVDNTLEFDRFLSGEYTVCFPQGHTFSKELAFDMLYFITDGSDQFSISSADFNFAFSQDVATRRKCLLQRKINNGTLKLKPSQKGGIKNLFR